MSQYMQKKQNNEDFFLDFGPEPVDQEEYNRLFEEAQKEAAEIKKKKEKKKVSKVTMAAVAVVTFLLSSLMVYSAYEYLNEGVPGTVKDTNIIADDNLDGEYVNWGDSITEGDNFSQFIEGVYDNIEFNIKNADVSIYSDTEASGTLISGLATLKENGYYYEVVEKDGKQTLVVNINCAAENYNPQAENPEQFVSIWLPNTAVDNLVINGVNREVGIYNQNIGNLQVDTLGRFVSIGNCTLDHGVIVGDGTDVYAYDSKINDLLVDTSDGFISVYDSELNGDISLTTKNQCNYITNVSLGKDANIYMKNTKKDIFFSADSKYSNVSLDVNANNIYIDDNIPGKGHFEKEGKGPTITIDTDSDIYMDFGINIDK